MSGAAAPAVRPRRSSAPARPLPVPPHPRRVSGPARRTPAKRTGQQSDQHQGIALGVIASVERVSRHRLLGGRTWIGLVAFALIGIVTMQLGLLKLNAGIGRALEHEALLQRENAGLSIENSEMAASGRITSEAVRIGMESVPAGAVRFLQVRPRLDARLGAQALSTPVDATAAGSAEVEAAGSSTTTSPTESSEASSTLPGTASQAGEPSSSASTSTRSPGEPSATESASTPSSGETGAPRGTEELSRGTGESANGAASGASSTTAGAPSGSAEGAPAGGTRAGSSG